MRNAATAGRSFPPERLAILEEMEDWHFWFDGRRRLVEHLLRNAGVHAGDSIVDVGSGTGAMVRALRARGFRAVGFDPFAAQVPRRPGGKTPLGAADGRTLPLESGPCSTVITLDVLEHTDDVATLREIHRVLRPGGVLVLTVPALPWLWSYHDVRAGHLRRYEKAELLRLVRTAGFQIDEVHYYQFVLLPLLVAARWRSSSSLASAVRRTPDAADVSAGPERASRPVNAVLKLLTRAEVFLGRWIAWPIGSTLALRCRKAGA